MRIQTSRMKLAMLATLALALLLLIQTSELGQQDITLRSWHLILNAIVFLFRHEHSPWGNHRAPLRHARLRPLAHHQPGGDGLRQPGEGQSRGGPPDGQAASGAAGATGYHHGDPDRAQQQLRLRDTMLSDARDEAAGDPKGLRFFCYDAKKSKLFSLFRWAVGLFLVLGQMMNAIVVPF